MIKIIKDISKEYQSFFAHIIVKNLESYFKARELFFNSYEKKVDFEIIIRNKNYFSFFLDFESYKDVEVKEIHEIVESKVDLGPAENIFGVLLNSLKSLKNTKKIMDILEKEYLKNYNFLFNGKNKKIEDLIDQLVKIVVFSNYKECNFNILMDDEYVEGMYDVAKEDLLLKDSFEKEKINLLEFVEKCNITLRKNSKKIQLFTEFPNEKYLNEINGELTFEKEYFLKMNIEKLNQLKNYENIIENLNKAEEIFKENYLDLKELINSLIIIEKDRKIEKKCIKDFKEYFTTIYLNYNSFTGNKNMRNLVEKLEKKYKVDLCSLKYSLENIWRIANTKFEEFYLKNYNSLYSSSEEKGLDYALENSNGIIRNGKRNIYIFIDCLRYDIWIGLKKYIETKGYNCHYDKIILSAVPTITSYCKRILYTGKKYNQIESGDGFRYDVVKISSIDDFNNLDRECDYLYEIVDLDNFFHSIKDLTEEYLQNSIQLKLDKILGNINIENHNLIIMTDHGAVKLKEEGLSSFSKYKNILDEKNLQMENHGRYIKIYSSYYDHELYEELNAHFSKDEDFYLIDRDKMHKYYLPLAEKDKENYLYLLYKYGKYPKKTGEYNHGGISLEEVMIPFGVFKTEKREYVPVDIEIKSEEIRNDSKAELDILFKNSNIIQNFRVRLKYQEYEREILEIQGNKKLQIPLKLSPELGDKFSDILELDFYVDNQSYKIQKLLEIKLVKSQKDIINRKLKNSRSLL